MASTRLLMALIGLQSFNLVRDEIQSLSNIKTELVPAPNFFREPVYKNLPCGPQRKNKRR